MLQQISIEVFIGLLLTGGEKNSANREFVAYVITITQNNKSIISAPHKF